MTTPLFTIPGDEIAVTSDDCYTPRWVFDAMGLHFDLDVAAPVGGPWHVPCDRYFTAEDDGLTQPWDGLVWCNPPYSNFVPWARRFVSTPRAVLMGMLAQRVAWNIAFCAAEAVALINPQFQRPDRDKPIELRQAVFVAFRGVGVEPAERLAAADPYGAVLYGSPDFRSHGAGESSPHGLARATGTTAPTEVALPPRPVGVTAPIRARSSHPGGFAHPPARIGAGGGPHIT